MLLLLTVNACFLVPAMHAGSDLTYILFLDSTCAIAKEIAAATMFINFILTCLSLPKRTSRLMIIMLHGDMLP